ncbi:MAG TPA: FlgD immunoglobulin-like domain containing protein, partial [Coriobacteriia bacterium]
NYPPSSLAEYQEFVTTVAARWKGRVTHWQLGIEPDLYLFWQPKPDAAAFAMQLKAGSAAIRASDPSAKVIYPGITTANKLAFLDETLRLGVADAVDVFAIHDYDNAPEGRIREDAAFLVSLVERYTSEPKECWCKEIGWSTYTRAKGATDEFIDGVTEGQQADNLVKRWVIFRDMPLSRIYTWELNDAGSDSDAVLLNFGLAREDLTPKAAFAGAKEILPLVNGATKSARALVTVEPAPGTLEVHAFDTEDGSFVLALWDKGGDARRLAVTVASDDIDSPVRLDLDGGAPTPVASQAVGRGIRLPSVQIGKAPTVLRFSRAALSTDPDAFSPDGDGACDSTRISFSTTGTEPVTLHVLDASGALVRTLYDEAALAPGKHEIPWTGDGDPGSRVADGTYTVRLSVGGTVVENSVTVDTRAPVVTNVASEFRFRLPDDERPFVFVPLRYTLSEPAHVTVDIFDETGHFYLQLDSPRIQPAGRNALDWPIPTPSHHDGWYWYRVTARDAAGNVVARESADPLRVDFRPPRFDEVRCAPESFSPDADGVADASTIGYSVSEVADIVASVRDTQGRRFYLYALRRQSAGRYSYAWGGRAYDPGTKTVIGLPDGSYTLELTGYDLTGNSALATAPI